MKVLTIKQPWASLIMLGKKKFEFHSWKTNYRGDLLIHAGKTIDKQGYQRLKKISVRGITSKPDNWKGKSCGLYFGNTRDEK